MENIKQKCGKSFILKAFTVLASFLFIVNISFAEKPTGKEKRLLRKARKELENEKYVSAQEKYLELVSINGASDVYNFEAGLSYYFSDVDRSKSIPLFESALKNSKEDTIPELKYYLGRAYHLNGQYKKSKLVLGEFNSFIKKGTKAGQDLIKETKYRVSLDENGIKYTKLKDENIKILNLGSTINTKEGEYAPIFRKEDNVLLFTARRKSNKGNNALDLLPYEDVYVAKKNESDSWTLINDDNELKKYLPKDFNTKKHDAGIVYSSDNKILYTYKKDALWQSIFKDNEWAELEKLDKSVNNSKFNIPSVAVSHDGNTIYFVSTRKDGFGGKDIYKSIKKENGNWSTAENLGEAVNTEFDEDAPFLSSDGKVLYFSSKGHDCIGGYDIYKSEFIDGKLTKSENMGIPINSPADDIYFVTDDKGESGFLSSSREGTIGGMDIFGFDMSCPNIENTEIRGIVYNKTTKQPIEANLHLIAENTYNTNSSALDGKFLLVAPPEQDYNLKVSAPGFDVQKISVSVPKQCEFYPLFTEIALERIEKDGQFYQVATLRNSFYNTDIAIADAQKNGKIDTAAIMNEVPFNNIASDKNYENDKLLMALSRTVDTSVVENYTILSDTIKVEKPLPVDLITFYQEFFGYNIKDIDVNNSDYIKMLNKAVAMVQSKGTISIDIESSASKVPTKTYRSNINLASLRGDEAKKVVLKSLLAKGISEDKVSFNKINSIVSGPNYIGDFKDTEKYNKYQYVKITIK